MTKITQVYHISSADNFQGNIFIARYIYIYIYILKQKKHEPTFHIFIFLISVSINFTSFSQALSFLHAALFGITQDPSGNQYLFTKLVPLSLGFIKLPLARNITVVFSPTELPIQRILLKTFSHFNWFHDRGVSLHQITLFLL